MGLLGKQTFIVKCPACQASTKVTAHPDKPSIRCPRCKVSVPMTYARKYSDKQHDSDHRPPEIQKSVAPQEYGSELAVTSSSTYESSAASKRRYKRYASGDAGSISYPDHSARFVRYAILFSFVAVSIAIFGIGYFIYRDSISSQYQEYAKNIKESIELHQIAINNLRKALDPLEGAEAQKAYREAKGRIDFLAVKRRRTTVPSSAMDDELKTVLEDLSKVEKELQQSEEDIKRMSTQVQAKPDAQKPPIVSPNLGASVTRGPPQQPTFSRSKDDKKHIDENTVIISLPGLSRDQWNDEFVKRFAILADNGQGSVTTNWSGDLLTLEVKPVVDPARYATRITFGRLLYYSRSDRILTIEFNPERVTNYTAQGDLITPILIDLKQRDKLPKIHQALTQLNNLKVDPARQAEVTTILETVASDLKLDSTYRDMAIKLIPVWAGKESADLLIRLLEDKSAIVRLAAVDALVESRSPQAASTLVKKWDKLDPERISQGLIAIGKDAEPVVLPFLNNTSNLTLRVEACRVLQKIGTNESLKPLLDIINAKDQDPAITSVAKEAMKQILERMTK